MGAVIELIILLYVADPTNGEVYILLLKDCALHVSHECKK